MPLTVLWQRGPRKGPVSSRVSCPIKSDCSARKRSGLPGQHLRTMRVICSRMVEAWALCGHSAVHLEPSGIAPGCLLSPAGLDGQ
eukprot:7772006-Pyramimonas_sp.AAC.1